MAAWGRVGDTLGHCLNILNTKTAHVEQFLSVDDDVASDFASLTKTLYDLHKAHQPVGTKGSPLEQLVVDSFDEEQIWQELELQNVPVLRHFELAVSQMVSDINISVTEEEEDVNGSELLNKDESINSEEASQMDMEEDEAVEEEPEKTSKPKKPSADVTEESWDEDSDVDFDIDALEMNNKQQKIKAAKRAGVPSEVDDKFFKLSEMEAFLEDVEKRDGRETENDEDLDYFQDMPSDGEEDLEEALSSQKRKRKSSRNLKYRDFFDPVEDGFPMRNEDMEGGSGMEEEGLGHVEDLEDEVDEEEEFEDNEESRQAKESLKRVTFDLPEDSDGEDVEEVLGGKKSKSDQVEAKSPFEKRQEKMAEKIREMEKAALGEKPWQLRGEVSAETRPENSLLEETVEFDQSVRAAPAITEETTLQLEDIIKQRIKDQVWDDVVRKEKPKEEVFDYKKRLTLDHEKSKLSLAEVYEQEYLKKTQEKTEEEENPAHVEIQKLMDSLFLKLDALSNFHFTPRPAAPDVKVVSNLPSISMEEVAPVSVSDGVLLAPEEVKEKSKAGDVLGDTEKSATDKNRERRKKKLLKRIRIQEKEKRRKLREAARGQNNRKQSKAEAADRLKKVTQGGKATVMKDEGRDKSLRSSQSFFSQLQDQVKAQIRGVKVNVGKKKTKKLISGTKLKL